MHSYLKNWFSHQSIRKKIIIIFVPLIIVSMITLGLIANNFFYNIIISKTVKNTIDDSTLIESRIDSIISDAESCANIMTLNLSSVIEDFGGIKSPSAISQVDNVNFSVKIEESIESVNLNFSDVGSCAFVDTNLNVYSSSRIINKGSIDPVFLKKIDSMSQSNYWFPMQKRSYLTTDINTPVLTLGKRVINLKRGTKIGDLVLNISENALSSTFSAIDSAKQGHYFIVDSRGIVISSTKKSEILKSVEDPTLLSLMKTDVDYSGVNTIDGQKYLIVITPFSKMGWKLISFYLLDSLTHDATKMTDIILGMIVIAILVVVFCASLLSYFLSNPIVKLTHNVNMVRDGNLDVKFDVESADEIGTLADGFNNMMTRITELLEKVKSEQKQKKEFELALLHSQIKPHFLYNCLDLIYVSCQLNDLKNAAKITKSLADFYRETLSKGAEIISIGSEIKNAEDYLVIQKIRFSELFDFHFMIDEDIKDCRIPKFTIQPIVENAIKHGIKPKNSHGNIVIQGHKAGGTVVISVRDDGVGMSSQKIDEILNHNTFSKSNTGKVRKFFGLYCVIERIKMYFGEEYGLDIKSTQGVGTTVSMTLPYLKERIETIHA